MRKRSSSQKVDPEAAERFAQGADPAPGDGQGSAAPAQQLETPWREPHVRRDVEKNSLVPIPEDYYLALQWLREQRLVGSQRGLIRSAALAEIDRLIREATGQPVRPDEDE